MKGQKNKMMTEKMAVMAGITMMKTNIAQAKKNTI
jgi:hypothetical protein